MSVYDYFDDLIKPEFTPPAVVFRVVWPILYILMFVSLYLFLKADGNNLKEWGFWLFITQLALNFMWSPVFFYYKRIQLAFIIAILLTVAVAGMIFVFYKASPVSGLINIPYLIWLIFADILNYKIIILNNIEIG